jgi:hypothetical protein
MTSIGAVMYSRETIEMTATIEMMATDMETTMVIGTDAGARQV